MPFWRTRLPVWSSTCGSTTAARTRSATASPRTSPTIATWPTPRSPATPYRAGGFTPGQRVTIQPAAGRRFTGPVAVLISRYSVSAAETFTQALINRTPAVVRVGEPTQGVFSDVLTRTLPNGWTFGLSNEIYLTDGRHYDITGVPPTVPTGLVFNRANLRAARDPELEAAMRQLTGTPPTPGRGPG